MWFDETGRRTGKFFKSGPLESSDVWRCKRLRIRLRLSFIRCRPFDSLVSINWSRFSSVRDKKSPSSAIRSSCAVSVLSTVDFRSKCWDELAAPKLEPGISVKLSEDSELFFRWTSTFKSEEEENHDIKLYGTWMYLIQFTSITYRLCL